MLMGYEAHGETHKGTLGKAIDKLKEEVAALKRKVEELDERIGE